MSLFEKYIFSYVVLVWGKAIRMSVSVLPVFVYVLYRHNYVSKCFETYVSNVFKFFFHDTYVEVRGRGVVIDRVKLPSISTVPPDHRCLQK